MKNTTLEVVPSDLIDMSTERITGLWKSVPVKMEMTLRKEEIGKNLFVWMAKVTTCNSEEIECPLHCLQMDHSSKKLLMQQNPEITHQDFLDPFSCKKVFLSHRRLFRFLDEERVKCTQLLSSIHVPLVV